MKMAWQMDMFPPHAMLTFGLKLRRGCASEQFFFFFMPQKLLQAQCADVKVTDFYVIKCKFV